MISKPEQRRPTRATQAERSSASQSPGRPPRPRGRSLTRPAPPRNPDTHPRSPFTSGRWLTWKRDPPAGSAAGSGLPRGSRALGTVAGGFSARLGLSREGAMGRAGAGELAPV
uniref:Uncharacterized protein n=1 Tax=Rangifer tarandus platyrhynchus TaxID=3082113 RepID=A0ACB0DX80_RANTA|nr:unnamed protein product [Rangifer tarandus platyrhynchus]